MEQRDQDHARHLAKKSDDIVVFRIHKPAQCARCAAAIPDSGYLRIEEGEALCMACAELDHLVILPSGDPALTRRASKLSAKRAIILRWARARKRYEREATLVEEPALSAAREQCAADAAKRAAKNAKAAVKREAEDAAYQAAFLKELKRLFPRCPADEAQQIAAHACEKYSGRVGRSAAAKELDPEKIRLAVIAHIRHTHTAYDHALAQGADRGETRQEIFDQVHAIVRQWQGA
jgi:hypothetical protein